MTATVLVCGGRNYSDKDKVFHVLDTLCEERGWKREPNEYGNWLPDVHIIHGGAKGADNLADLWAITNWCQLSIFLPDWKEHGTSAGPLRNQKMLTEGTPNLVVAFPGGRGTADMVRRAKKHGVEVLEIVD